MLTQGAEKGPAAGRKHSADLPPRGQISDHPGRAAAHLGDRTAPVPGRAQLGPACLSRRGDRSAVDVRSQADGFAGARVNHDDVNAAGAQPTGQEREVRALGVEGPNQGYRRHAPFTSGARDCQALLSVPPLGPAKQRPCLGPIARYSRYSRDRAAFAG